MSLVKIPLHTFTGLHQAYLAHVRLSDIDLQMAVQTELQRFSDLPEALGLAMGNPGNR